MKAGSAGQSGASALLPCSRTAAHPCRRLKGPLGGLSETLAKSNVGAPQAAKPLAAGACEYDNAGNPAPTR